MRVSGSPKAQLPLDVINLCVLQIPKFKVLITLCFEFGHAFASMLHNGDLAGRIGLSGAGRLLAGFRTEMESDFPEAMGWWAPPRSRAWIFRIGGRGQKRFGSGTRRCGLRNKRIGAGWRLSPVTERKVCEYKKGEEWAVGESNV